MPKKKKPILKQAQQPDEARLLESLFTDGLNPQFLSQFMGQGLTETKHQPVVEQYEMRGHGSQPSSNKTKTPDSESRFMGSLMSAINQTGLLNQVTGWLSGGQPEEKLNAATLQQTGSQLMTTVRSIFTDPALAPLYTQLLALLYPAGMNLVHTVCDKKLKNANALLQALYMMRSKSYDDNLSLLTIDDPILQNALLDRMTFAANLELIYEHQSHMYFKFLVENWNSSLNNSEKSSDLQSKIAAITAAMHSSNTKGLAHSAFKLIDYLPENKFRMLLIDPNSLWNEKYFGSFKAQRNYADIRKEIAAETLVMDNPKLDEFIGRLLASRQEMIAIYELLANKDKELITYCRENNLSLDELFSHNKRCILYVLTHSVEHIQDMNALEKERLVAQIAMNQSMVSKQHAWISIDSDEAFNNLFSEANLLSDHHHFIHPDVALEIAVNFLQELDCHSARTLLKTLFSDQTTQVLLTHLNKTRFQSMSNLFLKPFLQDYMNEAYQWANEHLLTLSRAQKLGRPVIIKLLEALMSLPAFERSKMQASVQLSTFLGSHGLPELPGLLTQLAKNIGLSDASELSHFVNQLPDGMKGIVSQCSSLPGLSGLAQLIDPSSAVKPPSAPEAAANTQAFINRIPEMAKELFHVLETALQQNKPSGKSTKPSDTFAERVEKNGFSKALVSAALEIDPDEFLLNAMKAQAIPFLLDYLARVDKKALHFNIVPQLIDKQNELLVAAIQLVELNDRKAEKILKLLLLPNREWNKKNIEDLAKKMQDPTIKEILNKYLIQRNALKSTELAVKPIKNSTKPYENSQKAAATVDLPDRLTTHPGAVTAIKTLGRAAPTSKFFQTASNDSLDATELVQMLATLSKPRPAPIQEAQSYALTLVALRFFQAYQMDTRPIMESLPLQLARFVRNALIHQQMDACQSSQAVGFILDGTSQQVIEFSKALTKAIDAIDARVLLADPLFNKLVSHGQTLFDNRLEGQDEYVKFRQRIIYTRWLEGTLKSFQALKQTKDPEVLDMVQMATTMLHIRGLVYCLREAACRSDLLENRLAMSLRHSKTKLTMPTSKQLVVS